MQSERWYLYRCRSVIRVPGEAYRPQINPTGIDNLQLKLKALKAAPVTTPEMLTLWKDRQSSMSNFIMVC
jgi:hypothetical protein